ncbi:MAG: FtsW/RodA/SpoVE family cell cycle protein, partial [Deltaproteobacteria bacterium]|nr:FtsW/RodA/SpoVE family cell cycle protein [Deltaproteobacteria bacterium]
MRKIDLSRLAENSCWPLILTTALLMAAGLVNLYSTSGSGEAEFASPSFLKQMAFSLAGLFGLTLFFLFDYRNLKSLAWPLFLLCLILLVLVKYFGLHAGGATRWLPLGPLRFQPSELTKIGLVLVLAHLLSRHQEARGLDFQDLLWPLPLIAVPFFLILKQPDQGTA